MNLTMKTSKRYTLLALAALLSLSSCKKKFEEPAAPAPLLSSSVITIDSIKKQYAAYYSPTATPTSAFKFQDDATLYCTVTADEASGNLYKSVYVRDNTGAIQLKLVNPGGLAVGDSLMINLNGVILNDYGKQIQLDSINIEKKIRKISSGRTVIPTKVTMGMLLSNLPFWESKLIRLDSVEFDNGSKNVPYADAVNKQSVDQLLKNSNGQTMVVRSSGYSNFAAAPIPCGKGSLVAIVGQFLGDIQLTLRSATEVNFTGGNCPILMKNFNDNIASGGWSVMYPTTTPTTNPNGSVNWGIGSFNNRFYAIISNFQNPGNKPCESWLISPPINLSNTNNPVLSFSNAYRFTGPPLQAMISTNYTAGTDPNLATWTDFTFTLSSGNYVWANSGNLSLAAYKQNNVYIAFKYTGTASNGSTWQVDDVAILEN